MNDPLAPDDEGVSFPCVFDTTADTLHFDLTDGVLSMVVQPHNESAACVVRMDGVEAQALLDVLAAALDHEDFADDDGAAAPDDYLSDMDPHGDRWPE